MAKLKKEDLLEMYRKMEDIRNFDNKVNQLVRRGEVPGMTHFSVGEEAANVGAIAGLEETSSPLITVATARVSLWASTSMG